MEDVIVAQIGYLDLSKVLTSLNIVYPNSYGLNQFKKLLIKPDGLLQNDHCMGHAIKDLSGASRITISVPNMTVRPW